MAVLSQNARWFFTIDKDNLGRVWEVASGKTVGKDLKLGHPVSLAAVSADGRWVAVLGSDNVLRVWNVLEAGWWGKPIHLEQPVTKMVVGSAGGKLVVATQGEDQARVWDVTTGSALTPPLRNGGSFAAVGFFAVGKLVATASRMGTVRIWEMAGELKGDESPDMRPIEQLTSLAQVLSAARIDERHQQQSLMPKELKDEWTKFRLFGMRLGPR
jgi:WD40 repeat protein